MTRIVQLIVLMCLAVALNACETMKKQGLSTGVATIDFQPAQYVAKVRAASGSYPNLYSPDSYALWVGPEVTAQRRGEAQKNGETIAPEADKVAPIIEKKFIVVECHLMSMFADMSVGYDVVGLRNVEVYMEMPGGHRVNPVQVIVGSKLEETQQGAIRVFSRTCLAIFPKDALKVALPVRPDSDASAKLTLAALDSTFYFPWQPVLRPEDIGTPLLETDFVKSAKLGYNELYGALANLIHNFD